VTPTPTRARLVELLATEATQKLTPAERNELAALVRAFPDEVETRKHFGDAFRSAQRVGQTQATPGATAEVSEDGQLLSTADTGTSRPARIGRAALLGMSGFGLPMLALAAVGVTRLRPRADRDRLSLMVTTTLIFAVVVTAAAVLAPVEPRFERYTDEFISRLYYAVLPAVAIGAGAGAAWLWPRAIVGRGAALVLGGAALVTAARVWLGWIW